MHCEAAARGWSFIGVKVKLWRFNTRGLHESNQPPIHLPWHHRGTGVDYETRDEAIKISREAIEDLKFGMGWERLDSRLRVTVSANLVTEFLQAIQ